ncbi:hypothetical protein CRM22_001962 [Opisthorchis felineus]|uniref:Uncharacterized protein n=1 Tax=Opisthorchis felineus TaxID=147828 RepID=A0A4S2MCN6_OPIFE|nr:hypothetical protein CRM22_001962 [Opisthorchis felineus]
MNPKKSHEVRRMASLLDHVLSTTGDVRMTSRIVPDKPKESSAHLIGDSNLLDFGASERVQISNGRNPEFGSLLILARVWAIYPMQWHSRSFQKLPRNPIPTFAASLQSNVIPSCITRQCHS